MQAYDYTQSYPQSSMTFGNALEYYGDQAASPYLPSLIADPQIVRDGRMRNGLYQSEWSRYTDWDSGARAIQVLQHELPVGMALPLLGAAQSGFDQARVNLREQYTLIEAEATNPLIAVLGRLGRVVGEGAYDFVDGFRHLGTLATDDKARRMALARGAYAITNPLETAKGMAIGGANYLRNASAEKMGEDALRFAVGGVLSAGAGKVFSAAGSFAAGSDVVASRLAGSAASRAVIDVLETPGLQGSPSAALHTRGTGMLTGVASYDQLFIESPQAIKMIGALERRGVTLIDDGSRLERGASAQVFRENGQLTLIYDSRGTSFVDMLHEARHVAQIQRVDAAGVLGDKDIFKSQRLLGAAERGAYEYEMRLGVAKGFSEDYMSYLKSQIDRYYPSG